MYYFLQNIWRLPTHYIPYELALSVSSVDRAGRDYMKPVPMWHLVDRPRGALNEAHPECRSKASRISSSRRQNIDPFGRGNKMEVVEQNRQWFDAVH